MSDTRTFVVVGAGQAARWVVLTLRRHGFAGRIVWFGDEAHRPYERPPLSKAALKSEADLASLMLIADDGFAALEVDFRPGTPVASIDRAARVVRTAGGDAVAYDVLFLATGGRARMLPGLAPHPRVLTLRTWDDARALKEALAASRRVLVLGGGWIGLEVAASARLMGREVTLLEGAPRLCARTVPPCVSQHLRELHERRGVTLCLQAVVQSAAADERGVSVRLGDGRRFDGDLLVVGIGLAPNDSLAAESGLPTDNGVLVDERGRSADPAVYAIGDVANALRGDGRRARIESWENAQRQGTAAARDVLGLPPDAQDGDADWFWSDQYDDNLQILGQPLEGHRVVERRVPAKGQRLFFFCDGPRIRALAAINAGREVKLVRKWMREDRFPSLEALADAGAEPSRLPLSGAAA